MLYEVITADDTISSVFEVRFKNNRKEFYTNPDEVKAKPGDVVLVECERGYDIGMVSLSGQNALTQYHERYGRRGPKQTYKILRQAKENDLDKIKKVRFAEEKAIPASRKIATSLGLDMKISDVEYQADSYNFV